MSFKEYTWERYYEDLYHRQKKENNAIAVSLGEAEAKGAELQFALDRVVNSSFWRVLAPARKIYSLLAQNNNSKSLKINSNDSNGNSVGAGDASGLYRERLEIYEDYYAQWIRKDPVEIKYANAPLDEKKSDSFIHIVDIEDCNGPSNPVDNSNSAEWLVFTGKNGVLAAGFLERLKDDLAKRDQTILMYADEDYACYKTDKNTISRVNPNFKPGWSPDTLDSFFYFGNICGIRVSTATKLKWLGSDNGLKNVYDLFLQASEKIGKHYDELCVHHIDQVLFHNIIDKSSFDMVKSINQNNPYSIFGLELSEDAKKAMGMILPGASVDYSDIKLASINRRIADGLILEGERPHEIIGGQDTEIGHILYSSPKNTLVSVLILSKDHPDVLKTCLSSFVERTDFANLEFIIVDNGSNSENKALNESVIEECVSEYPHKYIYNPMDFNFSKLCNIAASAANGSLYLFMNDDIEIIQKDWLKLMAGYALLPYAGAVGAKLLYANTDLIQHIGITNLKIGPSHKLVIYPDDKTYYYGKNMINSDMIGVTAACLIVSAAKFKQVGGFNEDFAVAYNDVDFCMKLTEAGFNNIQCNGAVLYHYESMTRGLDADDENKWDRLLHEKEKLYLIHPAFFECDPYYNENLVGNHSNYLSNFDFGYNNHLKTEIVRQISARELAEIPAGTVKISIDKAGLQSKINLREPEITEFSGWCYKSGEDNSLNAVNIILTPVNDGTDNVTKNHSYLLQTSATPRNDLEKTFPDELNIRLCGFTARVLKEDLHPGIYKIGIEVVKINQDLTDTKAKHNIIYTDKTISI